MRKRVVVTGLGLVTPIGVGVKNYWNNAMAGKSGVAQITLFDASAFSVKIAAEVKDSEFDAKQFIRNKKQRKLMGRSTEFAMAAASMAAEDAGLEFDKLDPRYVGVCIGAAEVAGVEEFQKICHIARECFDEETQSLDLKRYWEIASSEIDPMEYLRKLPNSAASHIAIAFNAQGINSTISTACAAGAQSIGEAVRYIEHGDAEVMFAGGTDARIQPGSLLRFNLLGVLSRNNDFPEKASRPFDAKRDGFVLGEGAGIVILESYEHAKKRNAKIYGEMLGYGVSSDAYRITDSHPEGRGAAQSMMLALRDAGLDPSSVDYINAHGTSTLLNDRAETLAIKKVFGDAAYKIPISSTKSMIGHLISAAGAVELITCILALQDNFIPPTINYEEIDPICDLDYVPNVGRNQPISIAMSNCFGFGGQNACLIVGKI